MQATVDEDEDGTLGGTVCSVGVCGGVSVIVDLCGLDCKATS